MTEIMGQPNEIFNMRELNELNLLNVLICLPLCAFQSIWNVVWIFFHQVSSDTEDWQTYYFAPIQFGHIKEEQLLILWR